MSLAASAVTNANLTNTQAVYYDSLAIDAFFANLGFHTLTTPKDLPLHRGRTIQLFSYALAPFVSGVVAGSTLTQATEGTVLSGLVPTAPDVQAVMGQYVDYITVSDMALDVAIDPMLENLNKMMGYRGSMIVDTIAQMEFDAACAINTTTVTDVADGSYLTAGVIRNAAGSLFGRNVRPFADGKLHGIMSPYVSADLFNDVTVNGVIAIDGNTDATIKLLTGPESGREISGVPWGVIQPLEK